MTYFRDKMQLFKLFLWAIQQCAIERIEQYDVVPTIAASKLGFHWNSDDLLRAGNFVYQLKNIHLLTSAVSMLSNIELTFQTHETNFENKSMLTEYPMFRIP